MSGNGRVNIDDAELTAGGYYNGMPGDGKASDWADIHNCIEVPLLDPGPFQSDQGQTQGWYTGIDPYTGNKYQEYRQ